MHTVVVLADRTVDTNLAQAASGAYSVDGDIAATASTVLQQLEGVEVAKAFDSARNAMESSAAFWDWDEDVDLIGVAKVAFLPAHSP